MCVRVRVCACFRRATVYNAARFCRFKGLPTTTAHRYLASAITIKTSQWFLTVAPTSIILPSDPHQLELFVSEQRRHLGVDEAGRRWAVPGLLGLGGCEGFDAHGRTGMDEAGRGWAVPGCQGCFRFGRARADTVSGFRQVWTHTGRYGVWVASGSEAHGQIWCLGLGVQQKQADGHGCGRAQVVWGGDLELVEHAI